MFLFNKWSLTGVVKALSELPLCCLESNFKKIVGQLNLLVTCKSK
jgi:hypothetical protein